MRLANGPVEADDFAVTSVPGETAHRRGWSRPVWPGATRSELTSVDRASAAAWAKNALGRVVAAASTPTFALSPGTLELEDVPARLVTVGDRGGVGAGPSWPRTRPPRPLRPQLVSASDANGPWIVTETFGVPAGGRTGDRHADRRTDVADDQPGSARAAVETAMWPLATVAVQRCRPPPARWARSPAVRSRRPPAVVVGG